jgi:alanyl-tRNA synthetase
MMTSTQIRQSFLDFFKSKQHTIVPSSSLMPDSPNLLFTNAGMNQFVPIFLGQVKCPYSPGRAADTQKCIRAGGKHNDLDDVGLDTYHHTFFEMLGNWSFADYFKKDAINWAWELIIEVWKFPPSRLYATIYQPDKTKNDPADRDQEAWELWAAKFRSVGLDPDVHIVNGNKKDNFWMMGETGPCGPCTEMHVDLRPGPRDTDLDAQKSGAKLVNGSDARCIEIWNNVFIQYNANPDGTFTPLPAQHVDTGMGFERVTSIIQGTKNLTDFQNAQISNYETDIFRPIFDALEKMSGKTYRSTLPGGQKEPTLAPNTPSRGQNAQNQGKTALHGTTEELHRGTEELPRATGELPGRTEELHRQPVELHGASVELPRTAGELHGRPGELPRGAEGLHAAAGDKDQEAIDIAFRVIADHIRTLSFAIADGIQPGNNDRNYVLRRILRRAVRYGRTLGFHEPFFYKLVDVLAQTMGDVFPEIRTRQAQVQETIRIEEEAFNKTLDKGIELFNEIAYFKFSIKQAFQEVSSDMPKLLQNDFRTLKIHSGILWSDVVVMNQAIAHRFGLPDEISFVRDAQSFSKCYAMFEVTKEPMDRAQFLDLEKITKRVGETINLVSGTAAFLLYDTYGFPLDLTELMARERGLTVDTAGFEKLMDEQRARARAAQKKEVISLSQIETTTPTHFLGYDHNHTGADVQEVVALKDKTAVVLNNSVCYAEMGGQVGDTGELTGSGQLWRVTNTQKSGNTWLHFIEGGDAPAPGQHVTLQYDAARRNAIQRHHTVTHLLHWALHEVASQEASQKGSFVGPDKLTFDFNSAPLTPAQVADIEKLVNERILENAPVSWTEVPHADVKARKDVMQFFGDKYGDTVRVVQIGGAAGKLDGYSMELCGGTHTRATGEIGLFRIVGENAIAAGVRRIEAVAGLEAYALANSQLALIRNVAGKINSPVHELEKKIEALLAQQKELEKSLRTAVQRNASNAASELLIHAQTVNGIPIIAHNLGDAEGDFLQAIADALKGRFPGVIVLGGGADDKVTLIACVSPEYTAKVQAGKIIQQIAPIVGGKGGGKPDQARGGGKDAAKVDEALAKAKSLLG